MEGARKIELQSPDDLAYLVANVRRAAAARIDEAFPPVEDSSEDELRTQIEKLVNEYITKTFTLAAPNLSINGFQIDPKQFLNADPQAAAALAEPEEVFEPFDARKRARVEALTAEQEDLLRDIAQLKKSVPGTTATAWADAARKAVRDDEEALEKANAVASRFGVGEDGDAGAGASASKRSAGLTVAPLDSQAEIEDGFEDAVRGLGRLKKEMPAVVARMERARRAGEYVVTER
ncbi:hypothetical protein GGR50DRAFT_91547 [Xylaria sp. CBS 124048]|nr:hypothetical protein GGR50DRAFT_91547 [Xylaria sp. CBS 124048]